MPAHFSGISSIKPTSGRLPESGQGNDGGFPGLVGSFNSIGVLGRTAAAVAEMFEHMLLRKILLERTPLADARFVPMPWDADRAKPGKKLKIGWYGFESALLTTRLLHIPVLYIGTTTTAFWRQHPAAAAPCWSPSQP